jgi:anti-sigma factor RsiW
MNESLESDLRQLMAPSRDSTLCGASADFFRYASGQLSAAERETFEPHLATCDECREDLRLLRTTDVAAQVDRASLWRNVFRLMALPLVASTAAIALFVVGVREQTEPALVAKGGYKLHVAVDRSGERFRIRPGEALRRGDRLGFFYSAPMETHLAILIADTGGAPAVSFATDGSAALEAGTELRLAAGAVVEERTGCEWIVAFFSPTPPQVSNLKIALQDAVARRGRNCELGHLSVPGTIDVFNVDGEAQ